MSHNRSRPNLEQAMPPRPTVSAAVAAETLRNAGASSTAYPVLAQPKGDERISLFWRVFGGTILSIGALMGITVYQSFAGSLNDLRTSINHVNELHATLATKDDVNSRVTALWGASKDVTAQTADLKTRTALLETQLRSAEEDRKELARQLSTLREQMQAMQLRQMDAASKVKADVMKKADSE